MTTTRTTSKHLASIIVLGNPGIGARMDAMGGEFLGKSAHRGEKEDREADERGRLVPRVLASETTFSLAALGILAAALSLASLATRDSIFAIAEFSRPRLNRIGCVRIIPATRLGDAPAMRHVLSALVQNQPGVLAHISGMLASRGFNIDSLAVGETEQHDMSRMTFVVNGDDSVMDQVRKQLDKVVTVVRVDDISSEDFVERDLMLIKVTCPPEKRPEISLLVETFRGRVVDIDHAGVMIEVSGTEGKVEAFIELMRPYGIRELARTGRIALVRRTRKESDE